MNAKKRRLVDLSVTLVNTRAGALFGQPGYLDAGIGMGREATLGYRQMEKLANLDQWLSGVLVPLQDRTRFGVLRAGCGDL